MARRFTRLSALLVAGLAGLGARTVYDRFGRFEISEASMSPVLLPGDYVVTDRSKRPAVRGDVVIFAHPQQPAFFLVKRVVGLPGEHLEIEAGRVLINGAPLDEPWTIDETRPDGTWELGQGEAFVLGDARWLSSGDSREIGPVPTELLEMRAVFRYWPYERIGFLRS